jgi:hypothetical protein
MRHLFRLATACFLLALPAACALGSQNARAQSTTYFDRNSNVSVLDRPRPDYEALGLSLESFNIYPSIAVAPEYEDNIFATKSDTVSDLITKIAANVEAKSNWSRDEVGLSASGYANVYGSHTQQDTTGFEVSGHGRLDVLTQSDLTAGASFGQYAIARTAQNTLGATVKPVQYDGINANFGGTQTLTRLRLTERFDFNRVSYENNTDLSGAPVLLDQLNNNIFAARLQAAYAISPSIAGFVAVAGNVRRYDQLPPQAPLDRNSRGYEVTVGTDFEITRLIRAQVQIGYLAQHYESPVFHTVSGPAARANIEYFMSGLTTVTLHADRQVVDAIDPVAVAFVQSQVGLQVDHELLRNLLLSLRGSYATSDYIGEPRYDQRVSASARATYLVNRNLGLTLTYSLVNQSSSGAARIPGYQDNIVSISLVLDQ